MALHEGYALLILPWRADYIYASAPSTARRRRTRKRPRTLGNWQGLGDVQPGGAPTRSKSWLYNVAVHARLPSKKVAERKPTVPKLHRKSRETLRPYVGRWICSWLLVRSLVNACQRFYFETWGSALPLTPLLHVLIHQRWGTPMTSKGDGKPS